MSRKVEWQRCFQIPTEKLDLFLVKINVFARSEMSYFEADCIFPAGAYYDVIVNEYGGRYHYIENEIIKFSEKLKADYLAQFGHKPSQ